jgi:hypothetical protein
MNVDVVSFPSVSAARRQSEHGVWELFKRAPDPRLRAYVLGYAGYRESVHHPLRRREVPSGVIPLIINFGAALRIFDRRRPQVFEDYGSFVAGLHETFALVGTAGASFCLQADFTPQGALRLFGLPMDEIANRVVCLRRSHRCGRWRPRGPALRCKLVARALRYSRRRSPRCAWQS